MWIVTHPDLELAGAFCPVMIPTLCGELSTGYSDREEHFLDDANALFTT